MISAKVLEMVFCNDALILWIRACNSIQSSNIGARWNYIMIVALGSVYMISGRLSPRREFTPVPSYGSVFVYMIPTQNVMPARVTPARVHPGSCA